MWCVQSSLCLLNSKHYTLAILRSWQQGGVGSRQQQTSHSRRFLSFISLFFFSFPDGMYERQLVLPPAFSCSQNCVSQVSRIVSYTRLFRQLLNRSYDETSRLEVGSNKRAKARGSSVLFLLYSQWHVWEAVGIVSHFSSYVFLWRWNKITRKICIEELL